MKVLSSVVLLLAIVAMAVAVPSELEEGFYLGRSGDVIISGNTNMLEASIQTSFEMKEEVMVDTQFASSVLRQLGMPFIASESSSEAMAMDFDIFEPKRANLMVVVDGVNSRELNLRGLEISEAKAVRASSAPVSSSASLLASMLTGATPRQHGIVADQWEYLGETEHAFIHAYPEIASISEIVAQVSFGASQIVSASASPIFARALGLRPSLSAYATHASALQYNVHANEVQQLSGHLSSAAQLNAAALVNILRTHFRDEMYLETPEHNALYAELAMILKSVAELSLRAQIAKVPDMYNFAITALNPIRAIHGSGSTEYASALALVRKTIIRSIEKIQHAYGNDKVAYEVLCLRSTPRTEEQVAQTIAKVAEALNMPFGEASRFWPHIISEHFNPCSELHSAGVSAYCPYTHDDRVFQQQLLASQVEFQTSEERRAVIEGTDADDTVGQWLMFMFTWILLAIITYIIWYLFYCMDIGEDSLLYRMTAIPQMRVE